MSEKGLYFLKNTGFLDTEKLENWGIYHILLFGMDYCSKFEVKSMIGAKVMAKSFCEDLTRNFRKFNGWFQLMANNFGCGHVNSTKICSNV